VEGDDVRVSFMDLGRGFAEQLGIDRLVKDPASETGGAFMTMKDNETLSGARDDVMFDNCRLLHGRTGFDPAQGLRHLQGCYIDIDGPRSLYRVLRRRLPSRSACT
ncbi:MAG: hypothetical protein ACLPV8_19230, partial [Steroidobacteraceae bacterium]